MKKVKLQVLGLSYSQTQAGAYALILSVENSEQRIPIIIGSFEAQAIAIQLEEIITARPLTHDLFLHFAQRYAIDLKEVIIYKLEEGVFYSQLIFHNKKQLELIESRTSDAVALALRFKCPIYTTDEIVEKAGIILNLPEDDGIKQSEEPKEEHKVPKDIFSLSAEELEQIMNEAIKDENYELASRIRDELNKRKKA